MDRVWLNGRWLTWQEAEAGFRGASEFENQLVAFWQQWRSGAEHFIFHTSGSTGTPRPISFTRDQMILSARASARALNLTPQQRALLCLPLDFVAGKMMMVRALVNGLTLVAVEPVAQPLNLLPDELLPHFAAFVPNQIPHLLTEPTRSRAAKINTVIIGGAALPQPLQLEVAKFPDGWYATYGMTETLTHIALQRLSGPHREPCFHCLPDVSVHLDERGCLVVSTPLHKQPVITNDIARVHTPTEFEILGRLDNVINSGGIKIAPEAIEQELAPLMSDRLPGRSYFVGGVKHDTLGQTLVLLIEGEQVADEILNSLEEDLKNRIPGIHRPKKIYFVRSFARTHAQKIQRDETLKMISAQSETAGHSG